MAHPPVFVINNDNAAITYLLWELVLGIIPIKQRAEQYTTPIDRSSHYNAMTQVVNYYSLLDTFLSDITKILYMTKPQLYLEKGHPEISDLIAQKKDEAINQIIMKKAKKTAGLGILKRLETLKSMGLIFDIKEDVYSSLNSIIETRHKFIHNRTIVNYTYKTGIGPNFDVRYSVTDFCFSPIIIVISIVYKSVIKFLFQRDLHEMEKALIDKLQN